MKTTERWTVPPADRAEIVDALHRLAAGQMDTAGRDRQVRTGMEQRPQLHTRHHRREVSKQAAEKRDFNAALEPASVVMHHLTTHRAAS
jgi:hypothetical protein